MTETTPSRRWIETSEAGESLGEGVAATTRTDLALTQVVLKSNRVSSKFLIVPAAVLRSFAVEAEPLIYLDVGRERGPEEGPAVRQRIGHGPAVNRHQECS